MSIIRLHARPLPDDPFAVDLDAEWWAGSFNTETATFWPSSRADDTERVWLTPSGRWVMTNTGWSSYITTGQARAWLARHGHHDAIGERIDVERDGRGRPEIGPEVKARLPEQTIEAVDALAARNGVSRAAQLRTIIMDTVYA